MKILIVDDQPMMLKTLEIKFVKEGYDVVTTTNPEDALVILNTQAIDVVLTEVSFNGSKDFEVLKAAKQKDYNIVGIIISIHSAEQTIIEAFESGAEEYLIKPVNLNLLSVRIRKLLKTKKMREVLAKSIPASDRQNILKQLGTINNLSPQQINRTEEEDVIAEKDQAVSGRSLLSGPGGLSMPPKPVPNIAIPTKPKARTVSYKELREEEGEDEKEEKFFWTFRNVQHKILRALKDFTPYFLIFTAFFIIARLIELASDTYLHGAPKFMGKVIAFSLLKDLLFCLHAGSILFIIFAILYFINIKFAKITFVIVSVILLTIQLSLSQYFLTTLVPLGADLWSYSVADIKQTLQASGGIKPTMVIIFLLVVIVVVFTFVTAPRKLKISYSFAAVMAGLFIVSQFFDNASANKVLLPGKEYSNNLSINKSWYFYNASWGQFFASSSKDLYAALPAGPVVKDSSKSDNGIGNINYVDPQNFPFLHTIDTTRDVLSPYFDSSKSTPNIVIILVEGLGRAFTNKNAYLGNFTPFLDSLSEKSLYWENFLSEGGRTFAVLPSVIGSLPFNKTGFNDMADKMPSHVSLLSILKKNGYNTSFYYGGDSHFDFMNTYLKKNEVNNIYDESTYPATYTKMPPSESGFSWGYGDKELFRRYFDTKQNATAPFVSILLTVSTHSPFIVNDEPRYQQRFEARLNELKFDETKKKEARNYKDEYASILFMDDAIQGFINQYKQRPDFANTIFLITGDHRMPEIPMSTKIDRYHVPLIIYSPLLRRTATFSSISTHFDITPSLTMLMHKKYGLSIPSMAQWMGTGLDTNASFRNIHTYPFKQVKNEDLSDFMSDEYFLNDVNLFRIFKSMDIEPEVNPTKLSQTNAGLQDFKRRNQMFIQSGKLIPDSLAQKWGSK